jgi:predicted nucleic acid-binding protein
MSLMNATAARPKAGYRLSRTELRRRWQLRRLRGVEKLTRKYADQPMDFADASLVLLATRSGIREILTADRRDFSVYRVRGRIRFIDVLGDSDPGSTKRR